jgi:predicted RNase H-like nuclease (RuvC/YqgF family)
MPTLDPINLGLILTTLISLVGAYATSRSAAKANLRSDKEKAEVDAYNRASAMDIKTIERQKQELKEFEDEQAELKRKNKELEAENQVLRKEAHK